MITKEEIDQLDDAVRLPLPTRWADGGAYLGDSVFVNVSILLPRLLKSYRQQMKQLVEKDATIAKMRECLEYFAQFEVPDNAEDLDFQTADLNFPKYLRKARQCL